MVQSNGWCTTTSIKLPLLLGSWLSLCTLHTAHNAASPLFPSYWTTLRQFRAIQDLADTTGQPARRDWNKFKCVRKVTEKCEESDRKVKQNFFSVTFSVNVFTFFCHFPHAFEFTSIPSSGRPGILLHNKLSCSPPVFLVYLGIFVASMVLVNSRSSLAEVWRGGGGGGGGGEWWKIHTLTLPVRRFRVYIHRDTIGITVATLFALDHNNNTTTTTSHCVCMQIIVC